MVDRTEKLLSLFEERDYYTVSELAERLNVSEMTIRRYLNVLSDKKQVIRTHGGASRVRTLNTEPVYKDRQAFAQKEKRVIAENASHLIKDGMIIAIDTGTTCSLIPEFLKDKNITVVTSSLRVMSECVAMENIKLLVPPGIVRSHEGSIYGPDTVSYLSRFHFDMFFMGVGGLDERAGLTDYSVEDVAVKQTLINNSSKLVVLADSSKINRITFSKITNLDEIDVLITNRKLPAMLAESIERAGAKVIVAYQEDRDDRKAIEGNFQYN